MLSDEWRAPRRLHPLSPVVAVARNPIGVGFAAALALATGDVLFVIALVLIAAGAVVAYLVQRWWFDGTTLHLRTRHISIHERSLAVDRVQQVDLREPLVARMLGLAVVTVESASGSSGSDIELATLSADEARRLRRAILAARAGQVDEPAAPTAPGTEVADDPESEPAAALPFSELVLAGLIGAESLAGGAAAGFGALVFGAEVVTSRPGSLDRVTFAGSVAVVALIVAFLVIALISAVASMVFSYAEFRLTTDRGEIRLRRGLLERREESTPVHRVQVISVTETPPQRALGRVGIRLRAAGTPGKESAGRLRIPIWHQIGTARLLEQLVPDVGRSFGARLAGAPRAALRRTVVRRVVAVSPAAVASLVAAAALSRWWAVPACLLLASAWPWGIAAYRALGLAWDHGVVTSRHGAVLRRTDLTPETKVQSTRVRSTPFQRRLGLATVHLDVAGTDAVRVPDRATSEATTLGAQLGRDTAT